MWHVIHQAILLPSWTPMEFTQEISLMGALGILSCNGVLSMTLIPYAHYIILT